MLISKIYQSGIKNLAKYVNNPTLEIRLILCHILKCDYIDIVTNKKNKLSFWQYLWFKIALKKRQAGQPLAYILKQQDFWNSTFYVNKNVLIPRNDSETLISAVLSENKNTQAELNILELGVGSGCLLLSLLQEYPKAKGVGLDISAKALRVAKINSINLKLNNRVALCQSDMFSGIGALKLSNKYDIIISNPPYIAFNDSNINRDVKKYEPAIALYAKDNGLFFYHKIFKESHNFLKNSGKIFVEIGFLQKAEVTAIAKNYGYNLQASYQDLGNRDRVLYFVKNI